jgi:hypothetical protein
MEEESCVGGEEDGAVRGWGGRRYVGLLGCWRPEHQHQWYSKRIQSGTPASFSLFLSLSVSVRSDTWCLVEEIHASHQAHALVIEPEAGNKKKKK